MMFSFKSITLCVLLVALAAQTLGHSYVTNPISRSNQKQSNTGCRGPNCLGPCDRPKNAITRSPISIQRGQSINVEWPRNNHAGGFIRLAWAPTDQSDNHAVFDANVQQINCHEVGGCKPDNVNDPNGGDSAPADGSRQPCKVSITVPEHLTDGKWTLQWAWYGGAFALGDYYSCVDYQISGGPSSQKKDAVFKGGDFSNSNPNQCKYFNTDRLHRCVNEPCDNPVYSSGQRSGPAFGFSGSSQPQQPTQAPTTPRPTQQPTQQPTQAPSTPRPTQQPTQAPSTPRPTQQPSGPSSSSCETLGHMQCVNGGYQTCTWAARDVLGWSNLQRCPNGLVCKQSGNYVYCDRQ